VTGGSRGIGRAVARALARDGATAIGTATSESGAESFHAALGAEGRKGTGLVMNVNDASQVEAGLAAIQKEYGDIAVLVNNAGITRDNLLLRMKDDEWDT